MSVHGVNISCRNRAWARRPDRAHETPPGVEPWVAAMVARRGVDDLRRYFSPRVADLARHGPDMKGFGAALRMLRDALVAGTHVGVVGDYDCDGACSTAIVLRALAAMGHDAVTWRIPRRLVDGYGLNERIVHEMHGAGVGLLVVLDSGTSAVAPVALARRLGMDVVILDHHEPGDALPDAVLVNPKRGDEDGSLAYLCTAGIAFLFVTRAFALMSEAGRLPGGPPDIGPYLALVALATVADVVPLVGLNRHLVRRGLPRLHEVTGLAALAHVTSEEARTVKACSFVLAPCVNAAGRLDDMGVGVELLVTDAPARAEALAIDLSRLNQERRDLQREAVEQAMAMVGESPAPGPLVLMDERWHPGIVGLVAAKVREAYDRPAYVVGRDGKGSARSVDGFDVGRSVISACAAGIIVKGGGHVGAAGFTLPFGTFDRFRDHVRAAMDGFVHADSDVDVVLSPGRLTPSTVRACESMEPFGQGNPRPRFHLRGGVLTKVQVLKERHVKGWVDGPHGETTVMLFGGVGTVCGEALMAAVGRRVDVLGVAEVNEWKGHETAFLKVEDVMLHEAADRAAAA